MMRVVCVVVVCCVLQCIGMRAGRVALEPTTHHEQLQSKHWTRVSEADLLHPIELVVALKQRNVDKLERILGDVSNPRSKDYGKYLSPKQVGMLVRPPTTNIQSVIDWTSLWAEKVELSSHGDFLTVRTTVGAVNIALETVYYVFEHPTGARVVRALEYSVPEEISELIDFIGCTIRFPNMDLVSASLRQEVQQEGVTPDIIPEVIRTMYNITVPDYVHSNLQAVVSFLGQYISTDDLTKFCNKYASDITNCEVEKFLGYNDPKKPGMEAALDIQFLMGITQNIRTWVYSTNGTTPSENEPFLRWLNSLQDTTEIPWVFSISYQDLEYTVNEDYAQRVNTEFMKWTATGRTFVTGSGDWGVGCRDKDHCDVFTSDFPSSSPYLVSLGSTKIDTGGAEIGISFSSGGFSNYFTMPEYQASAVSPFIQSTDVPSSWFNASGRAFPDLAVIGDNFQVVIHGITMAIGGTSASTPTFASMISMMNSLRLAQNLPTMGHIQPFLYQVYNEVPQAYADVSDGQPQDKGCCSYRFEACQGWDPYTGMGTPNYGIMASLAMDSSFVNI